MYKDRHITQTNMKLLQTYATKKQGKNISYMCQALTSANFSIKTINYTGIKLFSILLPTMRSVGYNKKKLFKPALKNSIYYLPPMICKTLHHMINSKLS